MCPPCGGFGRKNEGKEAAERAAGIPPSLSFFAHRDSRRGRAAGPGRAHRGDNGDAGRGQGETQDGHGATGRNLPSPERRSGAAAERRLRGAPVAGAAGSGRAAWGGSGERGSAAACSGARGAAGPPHG